MRNQTRNAELGHLNVSKEMNVIVAVLFAIAAVIPAIPLIVLVTHADKARLEIEVLGMNRDNGLLSKEEFDQKKLELLNRSLW